MTAANEAYHAASRGREAEPAARLDDVRVRAGVADAEQEERDGQQDEHEAIAAVVRSDATNMYVVKMPQAIRYSPTAWPASALRDRPSSKNCTNAQNESQNAP